jgi:molecular chaperone HtpG
MQQRNFDADMSRLLHIVTHALYSNKDVFLRELISNAADACDKLRYMAIENPDLMQNHAGFHIRLLLDANLRTIDILDTGIGMDQQDLIDHLGTIAQSGTQHLLDQLQNQNKQDSQTLSLIGQFGVGFYSSFMVADHVKVLSRKAGQSSVYVWQSNGVNGYEIGEASQEDRELLGSYATRIRLNISSNCYDYLLEDKIKKIITTYSNHISWPIYSGLESQTPLNQTQALWLQAKHSLTENDYRSFYQNQFGGNFVGLDHPALTIHFHAEGKFDYHTLLFVPTQRPWDLYDGSRKTGLKLYVKRVFITDQCEGLLFPWLRFVRGIVDSQDLPLNISREMLQDNLLIQKMRSGITKKILVDLIKWRSQDSQAFDAFWSQFGAVIKEGLYDATEYREDLFKICQFSHLSDPTKTITLDEYLETMLTEQQEIYYMSGSEIDHLRRSPQIEGFKSNNINVLLLTDTIDEFWIQAVQEYKGKKFRSVTKGHISLKKTDNNPSKEDPDFSSLLAFLQDALSDHVQEVRLSDRLTDSPVCLVASDKDVDLNLGKVLRVQQNYAINAKPILEINSSHELIQNLNGILAVQCPEGEERQNLNQVALMLLDQALIIQGEPLKNPHDFVRILSSLLAKNLKA